LGGCCWQRKKLSLKEPSEHLEESMLQIPLPGALTVNVFRTDKIEHGQEVVLRTTKHTMVYPGLGPSLEVIALRPMV
jgi:hypothetical protein